MNFGVNQDTYTPTNLIIPGFPLLAKVGTILSGVGVIAKHTVLGKITLGAATKAAKTGGNTGDGTLTLDTTAPILAKAKAGIYKVRIIRAALAAVATTPAVPAQKAIAKLTDPDGNILEVFDVPTDSGITISNQVKFVIVEGSTPFALGDGFDITIAAGSGKYKAYDADNLDGSQIPEVILAEDVDATSADVAASAYFTGHFNEAAIIGLDAAAKEILRKQGIYFSSIM